MPEDLDDAEGVHLLAALGIRHGFGVDPGVEAQRLQFVEAEMLGERLSEQCIHQLRGHAGILDGNGGLRGGAANAVFCIGRENGASVYYNHLDVSHRQRFTTCSSHLPSSANTSS